MSVSYTYRLTHKETGQFYIGSRIWRGKPYYSSSKRVKEMGFNNFHIEIIRYDYWHPSIAYWHEQQMIKENISNPLCLNEHYHDPETTKRMFYRGGIKQSREHIQKRVAANTGQKRTPQQCLNISEARKGKGLGAHTSESNTRRSLALKGKKRPPRSPEWSLKISLAKKGKPTWNSPRRKH